MRVSAYGRQITLELYPAQFWSPSKTGDGGEDVGYQSIGMIGTTYAPSRMTNPIVCIENCKICRSISQGTTHQLIHERRSEEKWVRITKIIYTAITKCKAQDDRMVDY